MTPNIIPSYTHTHPDDAHTDNAAKGGFFIHSEEI